MSIFTLIATLIWMASGVWKFFKNLGAIIHFVEQTFVLSYKAVHWLVIVGLFLSHALQGPLAWLTQTFFTKLGAKLP